MQIVTISVVIAALHASPPCTEPLWGNHVILTPTLWSSRYN